MAMIHRRIGLLLLCGALVPFPVPPRETTLSDQQVHDRKDRQDRNQATI